MHLLAPWHSPATHSWVFVRLFSGGRWLRQVLLVLLEKISRTDRFKEEICREGGVQVLVDSVANFILYEELVSRCLGYVGDRHQSCTSTSTSLARLHVH